MKIEIIQYVCKIDLYFDCATSLFSSWIVVYDFSNSIPYCFASELVCTMSQKRSAKPSVDLSGESMKLKETTSCVMSPAMKLNIQHDLKIKFETCIYQSCHNKSNQTDSLINGKGKSTSLSSLVDIFRLAINSNQVDKNKWNEFAPY